MTWKLYSGFELILQMRLIVIYIKENAVGICTVTEEYWIF